MRGVDGQPSPPTRAAGTRGAGRGAERVSVLLDLPRRRGQDPGRVFGALAVPSRRALRDGDARVRRHHGAQADRGRAAGRGAGPAGLSVAGHELKTPLTSLLLNARSLEKLLAAPPVAPSPLPPLEADERLPQRWRGLHRQIARLTGLVNRLLDVSRISAGKLTLDLEMLDLTEVARDVTAESRTRSPARSRSTRPMPSRAAGTACASSR